MVDTTAPSQQTRAPKAPPGKPGRSLSIPVILARIISLGIIVGVAGWLTPTLIAQSRWLFLLIIWVIAGLAVFTYATGRFLPLKYLLPGTLLLALFVIFPVVATVEASTTNFGDGTRGTKEETIASIIGSSVVQTPDAPRYNLTVATTGSVTDGPFTLFLVDPATGEVFVGDAEGLEAADPDSVTVENNRVTEADGYTILTPKEINSSFATIREVTVPTDNGAIRVLGVTTAFEGRTTLEYNKADDTITNTETGEVYRPTMVGDRELFVNDAGKRLSDQSWKANVGLDNYKRVFTDERIRNDFAGIFLWTLVFATLSVASTFLLGLGLAVVMNDPRMRGQKIYRSLLMLPYAIPSFIALLVWSSFYNRDFGLLNDLTGLNVNWLGNATTAKIAVLIANLWLGFPYMFLVCIGALQAIPADLKEAASIDGAGGFMNFRKITMPLLLVTVAPLLVASFAFNFNNYNAIALLTEGGPFSPANPSAGGTDILISYTMRLAFGEGGAQLGFASAVSVVLFVLTGIIAAIQFRFTRALEDVN